MATTPYCSRTDIENKFGPDNVALWSQLDNDSTDADTNRIAVSLSYGAAKINDYLRGYQYQLPLVLNSGQETLTECNAVISGVWLYQNRGAQRDTANPNGDKYATWLKEATTWLRCIRGGTITLDAVLARGNMGTGPFIAGGL